MTPIPQPANLSYIVGSHFNHIEVCTAFPRTREDISRMSCGHISVESVTYDDRPDGTVMWVKPGTAGDIIRSGTVTYFAICDSHSTPILVNTFTQKFQLQEGCIFTLAPFDVTLAPTDVVVGTYPYNDSGLNEIECIYCGQPRRPNIPCPHCGGRID